MGCHTDAYEQAKWFVGDIALKSMRSSMTGCSPSSATWDRASHSSNGRIAIGFAREGRRDLKGVLLTHYLATDAPAGRT